MQAVVVVVGGHGGWQRRHIAGEVVVGQIQRADAVTIQQPALQSEPDSWLRILTAHSIAYRKFVNIVREIGTLPVS